MKRKLFKALTVILSACLMLSTLAACGGKNWNPSDVTLKEWGAVEVSTEGGFVVETAKYVYYVNGIGNSKDDNAFGNPIKGSLMALDKTDYSNTCIVVPKLFVASDYNAGVYIYGDYVYYGTPSTDKNSSGAISNDRLTFARTKLDGTDTTEYFTVDGLSTEYRILATENDVCIVYYDATNTELAVYSTANKTKTVIANTSLENERESLDGYKFTNSEDMGVAVLTYTVKVYTDDYNADEKEAEGDDYSRNEATYNRIYSYKLGDGKAENSAFYGKKILDGEKVISETYAITAVKNGYIFYTVTDSSSVANTATYVVSAADFHAGEAGVKIVNTAVAVDSAVIVSLGKIYTYADGFITETTLTGDMKEAQKPVAKIDTVSTLLAIKGDYAYYFSADSKLARIKIANVDETVEKAQNPDLNEQRVSEDTVSTSWFMPEFVNGKVFYADDSATGLSYIKCVDISGEIQTETDDDGDITLWYLDGHVAIGKMISADKSSYAAAKIDAVTDALENDNLVLEEKEGILVMEELTEANAVYDALTDAEKKDVDEEKVTLLKTYNEALRISRLMKPLDGFSEKTTEQKNALKAVYEEVKAALESLKSSSDYDYLTVRGYVPNNFNWEYQNANKHFTEENA